MVGKEENDSGEMAEKEPRRGEMRKREGEEEGGGETDGGGGERVRAVTAKIPAVLEKSKRSKELCGSGDRLTRSGRLVWCVHSSARREHRT